MTDPTMALPVEPADAWDPLTDPIVFQVVNAEEPPTYCQLVSDAGNDESLREGVWNAVGVDDSGASVWFGPSHVVGVAGHASTPGSGGDYPVDGSGAGSSGDEGIDPEVEEITAPGRLCRPYVDAGVGAGPSIIGARRSF